MHYEKTLRGGKNVSVSQDGVTISLRDERNRIPCRVIMAACLLDKTVKGA